MKAQLQFREIRHRLHITEVPLPARSWQHGPHMELLDDLHARGLVHDTTELAALRGRLAQGPIGLYIGFDPTADSLHVGHLVGQLFMRRFQLAGHRPFPLAGGATGMIGDPGGRSEERNLLDEETLRHNVGRIKEQLSSFRAAMRVAISSFKAEMIAFRRP